MNFNLNEAKDLGVYKKLLSALGKYVGQFPATGMNPLFKSVVDRGMKILPKDERALLILNTILSTGSDAAKVQSLLNISFADLPLDVRPQYFDGSNNTTAFWGKNGKLFDRVMSLLNVDEKDKSDGWMDLGREKVKLIGDFVSDGEKAAMKNEGKQLDITKKPEDQIQALVEGDGTEFDSNDYVSEMGMEEAQLGLQEVERFLMSKAESEDNQEDPLVKAASLVLQAENILSDFAQSRGGK
jgi:hypothetical protein